MNDKIRQEAMHLHNWCEEQCDCVHCDFGRDNRTCKISGIPAQWFDDDEHPAAAGNMADEGWINIKDRPPEDGQLAAILTVFRGTTPGRMVARYLPKRSPTIRGR